MKCLYCQGKCHLHAWDQQYPNPLYTQWICDLCNAYVQVSPEGEILKAHWYNIPYRGKLLKAILNYQDSYFVIYIKVESQPKPYWTKVLELEFVPEWTLNNLNEKLNVFLPFL